LEDGVGRADGREKKREKTAEENLLAIFVRRIESFWICLKGL
jgi:hypothetical protein